MPLILSKPIHAEQIILVAEIDYSREGELFAFLQKNEVKLAELDRISNLNRRVEWMSVRELLIKHYQEPEDIKYNEHQKPSLLHHSDSISISHSHHRIALSIHTNQAADNGIDIQHISSKIERIKDKFMQPEELMRVGELSQESLSLCWSIKEALFKVHGKKDIYLKEHIEIKEFDLNKNRALATIKSNSGESLHQVQFKIIDDYSLAYTANW